MGVKNFFILIIFAFLAFANSAWSQTPPLTKYDQILQMSTRPTVEDFEKVMAPWPKANPFGLVSPRAALVRTKLPKVIASLELAFPGGTYAFLGRDSVYLADLVDTFYRSIGQPHRVARLNASGSSIVDNLIVDFLASNGLSVQTIDQSQPYVIIDRTSFGPQSQSTRYLRAFYDRYERTGKPKRNLIRKVNVVSTTPGADSLTSVKGLPHV